MPFCKVEQHHFAPPHHFAGPATCSNAHASEICMPCRQSDITQQIAAILEKRAPAIITCMQCGQAMRDGDIEELAGDDLFEKYVSFLIWALVLMLTCI